MIRLGLAAVLAVALIRVTQSASASEADTGRARFATCAVCHGTTAGARGMGPSLFGVVGRRAGQFSAPAPSPALANSGKVWTVQELDRFLASPARAIPGNRMAFAGISDPAKRRAIIDYLVSLK